MSRITVDQCFELLAQDRTGRITREMLQEFMQNPCGQGFVGMGAGDYPVDINFAESIEQMVARGNFNGSCLEINSRNFPLSGTGTVSVSLELVHFKKPTSTQAVSDYLEANALRDATMDELLAFGRTYPEYQQIFRIIALGSAWVDSRGFRYVGYLDGHASWRGLDLCDSESAWGKKDRFLAVRKWVDLKPEGATLTIGGRVYEPLSVLRGGEKKVHGPVVVERAKEMHANFGKEEGEHLLKHQGDIPVELRNSVVFVFVDWRHPKEFEKVCCISWSKNLQCWTKDWIWLDDSWLGVCRVLRRVS